MTGASPERPAARDLIEELFAGYGFVSGEIGQLCGTSQSTAREWWMNHRTRPIEEHHDALARLAEFLGRVRDVKETRAGASRWMLARLDEGYTTRPADLYAAGRTDDLLDYLHGRLALDDMLDRWNPDWRDDTKSS